MSLPTQLPSTLPPPDVAILTSTGTVASTPLFADAVSETAVKPKQGRRKKKAAPEAEVAEEVLTVETPALPISCAQCGKKFDYRDRIYNGEYHGLCNGCRQRHNKFLLKGQYQRLTSADGQVSVNVSRKFNRQDKRFQEQAVERMHAAAHRGDMQTFYSLQRQLKARRLID